MYHVCGSHKYASFRSPRFQLWKMEMTKGLDAVLKPITSSVQRPKAVLGHGALSRDVGVGVI